MNRLLYFSFALILVLGSFGAVGSTTHNLESLPSDLFDSGQWEYHTNYAVWLVPEHENISASSVFHKFAGQGSDLYRWQHIFDTVDINFKFNSAELTAPKKDSGHGDSGRGFDAETNNQGDGKTLNAETAPDSKSAMFFLLASGLIGLAAFGRKFRRS